MSDKNLRLVFNSTLRNITPYNESFDQGVLRIAYHGDNNNASSISKEVFESCIPTIYNVPVVANYMRDDDMIGGHDIEIVQKNRTAIMVHITHPVGVVPESANIWWELVTEQDASVHEYLCADVLLWKRQEAYEKIISDGIVSESMEIRVKKDHMENGICVIDDFEFLAFCLLGNCAPCFESASLTTFSSDAFTAELYAMLEEVPMATRNYLEGVTNKLLNEKLKLVEQYGLKLDDLDFELSAYTVDELEDKLAAIRARLGLALVEEDDTPAAPSAEDHVGVDDMSSPPEVAPTVDSQGDDFEEHSDEEEDPKKKNPEDEDEDEFDCAGEDDKTKQPYAMTNEEFASLKAELDELRAFKNEVLAEKKAAVFSRFPDLESNEDFKKLKENAATFDLETIEEKCFAIRGKTMSFSANSVHRKAPALPVYNHEPAQEPYGGLVNKYLR